MFKTLRSAWLACVAAFALIGFSANAATTAAVIGSFNSWNNTANTTTTFVQNCGDITVSNWTNGAEGFKIYIYDSANPDGGTYYGLADGETANANGSWNDAYDTGYNMKLPDSCEGKTIKFTVASDNGHFTATIVENATPSATPDATISFRDQTYAATMTINGFTLKSAKGSGSGSTVPTINPNAKDFRLYAGGTLTLSATDKTITKVVFNISTAGKKRLAPITANPGTIAAQAAGDKTVTWTGSANSITFTVGEKATYGSEGADKAGQLDFDSIDIWYTSTGGNTPTPTTYPAHLYIVGNVNGQNWSTTAPAEANSAANGVYTWDSVVVADKEEGYGFFSFVTATGADWNAVNGSDRYGATTEDAPLSTTAPATIQLYKVNVDASAALSWKVPAGTYKVVADLANMQVSISTPGSGPTPPTPPTPVGDGAITALPISVMPGQDGALAISMASDDPIIGFQFDVTAPAVATLAAPVLSDRKAADHSVAYNTLANGDVRYICYSANNNAFSGTEGLLVTIPFSTAANAAIGDYTFAIKNIVLADDNRQAVHPEAVNVPMEVTSIPAQTVTLDKEVINLAIGESATLVATVTPADATDKTVVWASDNTAVATVVNGVVTAVAPGTAHITATCGAASATALVTVGKENQTITWNQDLSARIAVGDEIVLSATASSGLAVEFVISSGTAYAHIENGKLIADAPGAVVVEARQAGNDTYAPAEPVKKDVTVWLGYIPGDASGDGELTVQDVATTVNYILEIVAADFDVKAADMDGDGEITIIDVTMIVDEILALPTSPAPLMANNGGEQFAVTAENNVLHISFSNMQNYIATQFIVSLPEGLSITSASVNGTDHIAAFYQHENNINRVVVYSNTNENFASNASIDLTISQAVDGEVKISEALVDRANGNEVDEFVANGVSTSFSGLFTILAADADTFCNVYSVDGVCVYSGDLNGFRALGANGLFIVRTVNAVAKIFIR